MVSLSLNDRFGKGNWKMILTTYTDILGDRTGVSILYFNILFPLYIITIS